MNQRIDMTACALLDPNAESKLVTCFVQNGQPYALKRCRHSKKLGNPDCLLANLFTGINSPKKSFLHVVLWADYVEQTFCHL